MLRKLLLFEGPTFCPFSDLILIPDSGTAATHSYFPPAKKRKILFRSVANGKFSPVFTTSNKNTKFSLRLKLMRGRTFHMFGREQRQQPHK